MSPSNPAPVSGRAARIPQRRPHPGTQRAGYDRIDVRTWWKFRRAVLQATRAATVSNAPAGRRDVLVLPCWRRPEFLWHCLDNLSRAEGLQDVHVVLRPDTGHDPANIEVIRAFAERLPSFEISLPVPCPYRRTKQSANLLLAYLQAAVRTRQLVYLLEEDTMIARDFFRWHRAVHAATPGLFCSIAIANPNRSVRPPADAGGYYLSSGDFSSMGVCFEQRILRRLIAPHVTMSYFRRPKHYVRRCFPDSAVGLGFVEQDGLLRRIQERCGCPTAYPCVPRAFDAGFYGYNRPGALSGSLPQRVEQLGQIIYDPAALRAAAGPEFIERCVPIDLQGGEWSSQRQLELPT
ncbi:MAG TPA: hypothetical protein VGF89_03460 [Steroidobacteraceae bacterium]|jgi:hypothetical protein